VRLKLFNNRKKEQNVFKYSLKYFIILRFILVLYKFYVLLPVNRVLSIFTTISGYTPLEYSVNPAISANKIVTSSNYP